MGHPEGKSMQTLRLLMLILLLCASVAAADYASYEATRSMVLQVLAGKLKPVSSSALQNEGD
jgi:hypothetical protein